MIQDSEFSNNGKYVISSGDDYTSRPWITASGKVIHILEGSNSGVMSSRFSPDDRLIATVEQSPIVRIWSTDTGRLLTILSHGAESAEVTNFAQVAEFCPDGKELITADGEGVVRYWHQGIEYRDPGTVGELVRRLYPFKLEDGQLVPVVLEPAKKNQQVKM